jgi:chaperonin GroES
MKKVQNKKDTKKKVVADIKIQPIGDRVIVRPKKDMVGEKTQSGIYIPDTVEKEKPGEGEVIAVGPGSYTKEGKLIPVRVKVGDTVIFSKYAYESVKLDGEELYILKEENIFAIIKK